MPIKGKRNVADITLRQAMIACRGNLSAVCKMLKLSRSGVQQRVMSSPSLRDLRDQLVAEHGSAKRGKGFARVEQQKATLEQIEQALRSTSGGVALAAKSLGMSYQGLHLRIQSGPESEALQGVLEEIRQTILSEAMISWRVLIRGEELPGKKTPSWPAVDKALRVYGGLIERHEVTGLNGGPLKYADVDAAKKRAAAELRIWREAEVA